MILILARTVRDFSRRDFSRRDGTFGRRGK